MLEIISPAVDFLLKNNTLMTLAEGETGSDKLSLGSPQQLLLSDARSLKEFDLRINSAFLFHHPCLLLSHCITSPGVNYLKQIEHSSRGASGIKVTLIWSRMIIYLSNLWWEDDKEGQRDLSFVLYLRWGPPKGVTLKIAFPSTIHAHLTRSSIGHMKGVKSKRNRQARVLLPIPLCSRKNLWN